MSSSGHSSSTQSQASLRLLGWWELRRGDHDVRLARREQRLLALLALHGRQPRLHVAATLWPESTEGRALSSLRAAVWHTRHQAEGVLSAQESTLALEPGVDVDVHRVARVAAQVATRPGDFGTDHVVSALGRGDLLPGWYDDWVLYEREHLEHLRLRGLEAAARARLQEGDPRAALTAARAALTIEPLHEGVNVLLVRACLAAGNSVEAMRHFHSYRRQVQQELGIRPSQALVDLVAPLLVPRQRDSVASVGSRRR
jgi:DNA-binding SARP family transcriptional activator